MPVRKGVLSLGSLCIEKITQMLIKIVNISQPKSKKQSCQYTLTEDQKHNIHTGTQEPVNTEVDEGFDHHHHSQQEETHSYGNGAQNAHDQVSRNGESHDQVSGNGDAHDQVNNTEEAHDQVNNSEEAHDQVSSNEEAHDQVNNSEEAHDQVSSNEEAHDQVNNSEEAHDQVSSNEEAHDQISSTENIHDPTIKLKISGSNHEVDKLDEPKLDTTKVEDTKEESLESNSYKLEKKDTVQENIDREIQYKKELEAVRQELCRLLTSHSHVTLHRLLFDSIMTQLDPIYMRDRKVRPAAQDIIIHFINSTLRDLDFGRVKMFSEAEMCKVLYENLHKATRLEKLVIGRSCYWRSQIFEKMSEKLVCMPHLTVLKIQYIATPEMIHGLSKTCSKLYELSLAGSENITDQQCDEIAKCAGLTLLDISGTRITGRGCWKILDAIKSLSWLRHCAFNCNSDALLFESRADLFNCIKEQLRRGENAISLVDRPDLSLRDARFNLKNFWLFNPFTEDLLTSLLCPDLESLRLDFVFQDLEGEPDLTILSSLTQIRNLEANLYDRCSIDLVGRMVEGCGKRLTTLELHLADDWFFVAQAHNIVATCCPNLVTLTFSGDYKARHSLEECDDRLDFGIPTPAHPHLKHLKLIGVVSDQRLNFILNHTPALHTLRMDGELEWLHDVTFATVLETNPLPNLEEMWFNVSTTVTLATVRRLLRQDNPLRCIGRLCHMSGATMNEYQELLAQVRQRNLDIKLIWVTDERIR
ncbi:uncharacterized protein LOC121871910 isoform X2 [Homarus americanus]|uniref:uncharacterized protein LOC121871910 isoform X2 n=1 Tax=Homarus americanus TaxID=6706 RepID=UPI001C4531D2|nr:uncharacterized protein LOC121871910 isoform X2 [Homarus americanus]